MNGLELSRGFFEEYGLPMLKAQFPALMPYLAAGLCGSGSECFGFDDDVSRDHDFEPGFCLFLPGQMRRAGRGADPGTVAHRAGAVPGGGHQRRVLL